MDISNYSALQLYGINFLSETGLELFNIHRFLEEVR